jgi:GntP family gluconate:H+ symporter
MAVALSTGLYATHTLVPPTPGPIAAAGNVGADLGLVILIGMVVSIPAALTGLWWAHRIGKDIKSEMDEGGMSYEELKNQFEKLPSTTKSFMPIVIPILLIALASIAKFTKYSGPGSNLIIFLGTPVNALMIGMLLSLSLLPKFDEETLMNWVGQGIKDSAIILLITGAGGSLGAVLSATPISDYIKTLVGGGISGGILKLRVLMHGTSRML